MRYRLAALFAAALAIPAAFTGCTSHTAGRGAAAHPSGYSPATPGHSPAAPGACPASYIAPEPDRPAVTLSFTVAPDLASVSGTEHVEFTPDEPITQLVFRLTANTAPTVLEGNSITVTSARGNHGAGAPAYIADGAGEGTQGGLLELPYSAPVPAGTRVSADLSFRLTLGAQSFDRFGRTDGPGGRYAWFASAQPLLAWQRGIGWHTEPLAQFPAESTTSEAARTDLTVTAPAADTVLMSGDPAAGTDAGGGAKRWHATSDAARDVSVAVGPFSISDTRVGSVRLRVGAPTAADRDALVPQQQRAITELARRFGPFPFPSLSVASLPVGGGGIEYPGSILLLLGGVPGKASTEVVVHETAHQWFYALVGDSQAAHPWLDEAFASYAEQLVDDDPPPSSTLDRPGVVDSSVASYGANEDAYYFVTYDKGAAALHAARQAAGAAAFDAAIRCYVNAGAWRIADPADLATALKGLPAALAVLTKAGALP